MGGGWCICIYTHNLISSCVRQGSGFIIQGTTLQGEITTYPFCLCNFSPRDNITASTGRIEDYKPVVDLAHLHIQLTERYSENSGASSLAGPL